MKTSRIKFATAALVSLLGFVLKANAQSAATDFVVTTANNQVTITGYVGAGGAVVIPATIGGFPVTLIGQNAFYGTTTIKSVTVPAGVTEIQPSAFSGCTAMTSATLPNSVTSVDSSAFSDCSALTTVNLGSGVTAIGDDAFAECSALANITLPSSLVSIGQQSFEDCTSLTSVTLGSSLTTVGSWAFNDTGITSVNIPASVSSIGDLAFAGCANLTAITVASQNANYSSSNGVLFNANKTVLVQVPAGMSGSFTIPSGVTTIGDYAFWNDFGLTAVTIPSGVTTINPGAFEYCTGLSTMTIPSGVTSIGDQAFYGCSGLLSVVLPPSLSSLGNIVFYSCTSLVNAFFEGNAPTTGYYIFASTASNFVISYTSGASGFTSPTWTDTWGDIYPSKVGQLIGSISSGGGSGSGGSTGGSTGGSSSGGTSSGGSSGSLTAQTITFSSIPTQTFGVAPMTLSATASSGLAVTFSIVSGPATISGKQLTIIGAGTVVVAANQAGNTTYSAATQVTNTFTVNQASQTIAAFSPIATQTYGNHAITVAVPAATSKLPVTVTVQSGPATISSNVVTITGVGTVVLAANQGGNANYSAAPQVTTSFVVNGATQTIAAFAAIGTKTYSTTPFAITLPTATSGLPVAVDVVSGPATISGNSVTMTGVGTVVLAANQGGNSNYQPATEVTTSFSIAKASQTIAAFAPISGISFGMAPFAVTAPAASSTLPVTLSVSSGPATISNGTVTITGAGTVVLAANQAGNSVYNAATQVTTSFVVGKEVQTISNFVPIATQSYGVAPLTISLPTATSGLPVTVAVLGAAHLTGNVLTVTGTGTVTLTASQAGNTTFAAATAVTTSFVVNKLSQTIGAFAAIPNHTYGDAPFAITLPTASSALAVTLRIVSGPATLVGNTLYIQGGGTVVVGADQAGNTSVAAATEVTTSFVVAQKAQTIAAFSTIANTTTTSAAFVIYAPAASSGLPATLSILSGPATIASGRVTVSGAGTVVVAADQAGNANYLPASEVTTSFTVTVGVPTTTTTTVARGNGATTAIQAATTATTTVAR